MGPLQELPEHLTELQNDLMNPSIVFGNENFGITNYIFWMIIVMIIVVVAILVVLFGIGIPAVLHYQKVLKLRTLDDKAQTIYAAVQNRLGELIQFKYNPSYLKGKKEW